MGCGSGRFTIGFAQLGAKEVTGVDLGVTGIEIGRKNIGGNPPLYNSVPFTDHESAIYRSEKPDRITISNLEGIINSGENIQVEINGDLYDSIIINEPLYDPSGKKMRT